MPIFYLRGDRNPLFEGTGPRTGRGHGPHRSDQAGGHPRSVRGPGPFHRRPANRHQSPGRHLDPAEGAVRHPHPFLLLSLEPGALREWGIPQRKEQYIRGAAEKIAAGDWIWRRWKSWTTTLSAPPCPSSRAWAYGQRRCCSSFSLQRPDVLSRDDLAIKEGCGCCTAGPPSATGNSIVSGGGILLTPPWPLCISGPSRRALWKS